MKYNKYFKNEKNQINVIKNIKHATISIQLKKQSNRKLFDQKRSHSQKFQTH